MKKRKIKKYWIVLMMLLIISLIGCMVFAYNNKAKEEAKKQKKIKAEKALIKKIENSFSEYAKSKANSKIYDKDENIIGYLSNVPLKLKKEEITKSTKYFYAENVEAYISYKDIEKSEKKEEATSHYTPFNLDVTTKEEAKIYIDENSFYQLKKEITFNPILIDEKYYFIFDGNLVYVNEEDIKEKKEINKYTYTKAIPAINYHYVVNEGEAQECRQSICIRDYQYDKQMKYLKDNGYYTATLEELENWIDGKANLPEKTVIITIDDGWYLPRNIEILEKYDLHATLFLIGHLASPDEYKSKSIEIHSHTWDMHNLGECPVGRGGAILCKDKNYILEDLKKSRESLNNTKYFAYPFYEYNDHAIEALKEAGFTMAFAGSSRKIVRGVNKFKIPRYGITNSDTVDTIAQIVS